MLSDGIKSIVSGCKLLQVRCWLQLTEGDFVQCQWCLSGTPNVLRLHPKSLLLLLFYFFAFSLCIFVMGNVLLSCSPAVAESCSPSVTKYPGAPTTV